MVRIGNAWLWFRVVTCGVSTKVVQARSFEGRCVPIDLYRNLQRWCALYAISSRAVGLRIYWHCAADDAGGVETVCRFRTRF